MTRTPEAISAARHRRASLRSNFVAAVVLAVTGSLVVAAPALADPQPGLGTTVDVIIEPGTQSGLEATVWLTPSGGTMVPQFAAPATADTTVELHEGATLLASCTVLASTTGCSDTIPPLSAGSHDVSYTFDNGVDTVTFDGVLFAVDIVAPTVTVEWQDAAGNWVDTSGIGLPLLTSAGTAGRCVVTNNSNAPATFGSANVTVNHPSAPSTVVPITGTIAAGQQLAFIGYSGLVSGATGISCSLSLIYPASTGGTGGNNSGGIIPVTGTFSASPLSSTPGGTVTVSGVDIVPSFFDELQISVDGAAVGGTPVVWPGGDFDIPAVLPTAAGPHTIAVQVLFSPPSGPPRLITLAVFTATVNLASTGAEDATGLALAASALLLGGAITFGIARVRRGGQS